MIGWPASDSLRMLARRYHDERCQNRFAAASASTWVAASRSSVAAQAGRKSGVMAGRLYRASLLTTCSVGRWPLGLCGKGDRLLRGMSKFETWPFEIIGC